MYLLNLFISFSSSLLLNKLLKSFILLSYDKGSVVYIFCFAITGTLNANWVNPGSLDMIVRSPPRELLISLLHASPIPMVWSFTFFIFYFILSSKNGTNNIFYLSGIIPIPVSITVVSRIYFKSSCIIYSIRELLCSSSTCYGRQFSSINITPF